jgi:hypothetical protein
MKNILLIGILLVLAGCASPKGGTKSSSTSGKGDTRTKAVENIDNNTYLLVEVAEDRTYALDAANSVKVGGSKNGNGPLNERRYLNALLGPKGEPVKYSRAGSCCAFKTPNAMIGDSGLLDRYRVTWEGSKDTVNIFLNMYDEGDLKIPSGFTAKKKE